MTAIPFVSETSGGGTLPIWPVTKAEFDGWCARQPEAMRRWLQQTRFQPEAGKLALIPGGDGGLAGAVLGMADADDFWAFGAAAAGLPAGAYHVDAKLAPEAATRAGMAWALGAYGFDRYRKSEREGATLVLPAGADRRYVAAAAKGIYLARDLINTPAADMGPAELAAASEALANEHDATFRAIVGDELLARNYPAIHAVGRAAAAAPRLVELVWGRDDAPKVTLVGKGVCFDSGGLDIKPAAAMLKMKKDMGGAATMLGLAAMVMETALPVRLRVLIPAVENAISGNAFRPGDVLPTRKGLTVEVGNTDAEGRLVLCDALADADAERPDLLLDCATLTGAARVALGPDLPALFTDDDGLAGAFERHGRLEQDPVWRLPLHEPYRAMLKSRIADLNNVSEGGFAGAVTAALYLKSFVTESRSWAHIDTYAWSDKPRPGRPAGGEPLALRAIHGLLAERYGI